MSNQTQRKLKLVLEAIPPGYLVTATWLADQGIAYASFRDYVKRGWLERVARGVFRRPAPSQKHPEIVEWQTCMISLQHILGYALHIGAATALRMQGYGHYLPLGEKESVWLYGDRVPSWLSRIPLNAQLITRKPSLFEDPGLGLSSRDEERSSNPTPGMTQHWTLIGSSAERAILELIDEVPERESLENVDKTFELLANLRPGVLAELLHSCKRIKTKRLFFVFADRHDHAWRKYVNPQDFDLGVGDRALVPGGSLHPLYRIVIPRSFLPTQQEH